MNTHKNKQIIGTLLSMLFILAIASIFYAVFGSINISDLTLSSFFYYLAQFLALTGFLFISLLIISGDFARLFDKYFGIDKIIKTQRKFSIFTYFIVFSHPLFIILSQNSYVKYLIPRFSELPFAAGAISLYIFAGIMISSLLYKRVSYKTWQYLHVLTYVLFFFILYHAKNVGSSVNELSIKIIFYTLTILVILGIVYRTNYKLKQRKNQFFLKEIKQETNDTFTLVIEPKQPVAFKPGQFFFLRLDGRKLYARHPFSVSNVPEKYLNFTIKDTGRFTKEAKNLKPGDEIRIEGPFGKFIVDDDNEKDLVFIAGGVGITPFMSMIKDNINKSVKRNIILLYGSKTEKDIIFKKELDSISQSWFRKVYVLSNEKTDNYDFGRIDEKILLKYVKDVKDKKFYICGPKAMMDSLKQTLKKLRIKKEDIVIEDFFW
ncbi:ferric reductase-like transmembrane domain-containing protein [Candidatus Pacearchaeota archaeon]|nr:ferric reductase-like transmembrane domain-containing protein [Candidatus Pacearchaeota archaeon]